MSKPLSSEEARAVLKNAMTGKRGVSQQRMNQLLNAGRVVGAYRTAGVWQIPQPVKVEPAK